MIKLSRYILFLTTLAAAISCRPDSSVQDGPVPITFDASESGMEISAKAGAELQGASTFNNEGNTFAVYGTWTVPNGTSANIFTKQTVTRGATNWTYAPLRYWQKSGSYIFRGVYPITATTTSSSNGSSLVVNYSMSTEDYDLMVANSSKRDISTGNTDPVPMSFRHALAAVRFIFQKGSQTTVDYHLMSFDLQYLLSVGTLVFNSIAQDASLDSQWWVADDFRPASLYPWSGDIQVPSAYADWPGTGSPEWEEWHCVLPQKLRNTSTEEKPSVRFSSSIKTGSDYSDPAFTIIELPETYTYIDGESVQHTVDAVWEAGKKYTYYIQIQPSGASIKVYATDWDSYKVAVEDLMF